MDDLIEEILAEMPDSVPAGQRFVNLAEWGKIFKDVKDEFEVDCGPVYMEGGSRGSV